MGLPMARRLLAAGHDVVACDPDATQLQALGAPSVLTPAEAAGSAEVVITSLPSVEIVRSVVAGPDGVAAGAKAGTTVIDMSTGPPGLARDLASELAGIDVEFLDAPVSGGPIGAEAGTLAIMVGGPRSAFDRWNPLLQAMGALVEHVGDHGAGQTVKLCNNLIVACTMAGMAEACVTLEREGVDSEQAYAVWTKSTSDSTVMRRRFPLPGVRPEHPATRDYEAMFRIDLLVKDVRLALDLAADHDVSSLVGDVVAERFERAAEHGFGNLDYSAVYLDVAQTDP
jgi:3-hydroxyisobutyrate dehydrogenase